MPTFSIIPPNGARFGRLTVIRRAGRAPNGRARVRCECDCGRQVTVKTNCLLGGRTRSCGCLQAESRRISSLKHGGSHGGHPLYSMWKGMHQRCRNPRNKAYTRYGGRGITVCERWADFARFLADMGERPSAEHSIDRLDNEGDYEPGNCRWATPIEQRRNQRHYQSGTCRHGHPYTPENTYWTQRGGRVCRKCNSEAHRRYIARKAAR